MQSTAMLTGAQAPVASCQATGAQKNAFKAGCAPMRAQLRSVDSAFSGSALVARQSRVQARQSVAAQAMIRQYPDPEFIALVKEEFPDKGIATVDEARVLFSSDGGYTYLDVRPTLEYEDAGKVAGSVNIPIVNSKWVYDPEARKKNIVKEENAGFVAAVKKRFPNPEHPLLIGCSDGVTYSIDALEALDEEGYTNIVGLRGGYYAWFRTFDNKMRRRTNAEFKEVYSADGDSCGIHSSGAGFDRVDAIEAWVPPKY